MDINKLEMLEFIMSQTSFSFFELLSLHEFEFFRIYHKAQEKAKQKYKEAERQKMKE